ncbi:MAG TPA: DUF72 domain-containing protein [Acidimicrobiales bacterium]|nr:DUF72 domain-containing protein [Acidimicrobiales bacterium]
MTRSSVPTRLGSLYVGTSGFAYDHWREGFYPEGLPAKHMLRHYATVLPSVEINYTFRRDVSEAVVARWRDDTPADVRFTLKAHQRITHYRRLGDTDALAAFLTATAPLGERLGTILFQLPPNFRYDRDRLQGFLSQLPHRPEDSSGPRYALEVRHESWAVPEVTELLSARGVALVGSDTDAVELAGIPVTARHVYLRLRRETYSTRALAAWARRIRPLLEEGRDVFCYFKHEGGPEGPGYALDLRKRLRR